MGAPAEAALVANHGSGPPPAHPDPNAQRPGTGTARAAPIDPHALHVAQQQQHAQAYGAGRAGPNPDAATNPPHRSAGRPQKKSGAGLIIALAVVALLLGAGAVVAYVMGTAPPTPIAVEPLPTVTTLTTPATTTPPTTPPPTNTSTATPLTPPPQVPVTPPKPHPSGSAAPKPSGSAAPPPSNAIPPFPPFPSALPMPSGFPSAFPLPSGFPTFQVPSGFPTFPPPPAPPPG
jgi:hypothetical protein